MTNFLGLESSAVAICFAAILAGGLVKGMVGLGLPLVALPIMVSFIPLPKAIGLLIMSSFATSAWQSVGGGHLVPSIKRFWPLLLGLTLGIAISVKALVAFDMDLLYLILGAIILAYSVVLHRRLVISVVPRVDRWLGPLVGLIGGLVCGISMLLGPIFAMYFSGLRLPKETFIGGVALTGWYAMVVLSMSMSHYELFGGPDVLASVMALIPSFLGLALGQFLRRHVNEDLFRKCLAAALFLIGVSLILKGSG